MGFAAGVAGAEMVALGAADAIADEDEEGVDDGATAADAGAEVSAEGVA